MNATWPVMVLGGSGYVSGELLRLVALHPRLSLEAVVSTSQVGELIPSAFPHLASTYPEARFESVDNAEQRLGEAPHWVLLSAAPHGASAEVVDHLLSAADAAGVKLTVVDASADFRYQDPETYASLYGKAHPAPQRIPQFRCAVPEQLAHIDTPHAAHPGCFTTALLLGIVPLTAMGLATGDYFASGVTGSTGAGRTPRVTTHHPQRHNNMFAYQPLAHRHGPEVKVLTQAATGRSIGLHFVPHSGPFARGILTTVFARHNGQVRSSDVTEALMEFYKESAFVQVASTPPRLKDIVASNFATIAASADAESIVVYAAIDNLIKGAAGGSIQWANRLLGLPETEGLTMPTPGWL